MHQILPDNAANTQAVFAGSQSITSIWNRHKAPKKIPTDAINAVAPLKIRCSHFRRFMYILLFLLCPGFFTDREYHIICTIIVPSNMESSLKFASGGSAAENNHPQKDQDTYRTGYLREYWQSNPAEKNKNYTHKAE